MQFLIIRIQSNNVCLVFTKIHSSFGVSITDKWIYVFTHCTSLTSKTYSTVSHIHTYIFDHLRFASTLNIYIENAQEDQQPYICRVMPHNVYIWYTGHILQLRFRRKAVWTHVPRTDYNVCIFSRPIQICIWMEG